MQRERNAKGIDKLFERNKKKNVFSLCMICAKKIQRRIKLLKNKTFFLSTMCSPYATHIYLEPEGFEDRAWLFVEFLKKNQKKKKKKFIR